MAKKAQKSWTRRVSGLKSPQALVEYSQQVFPILNSKTAVKKAIAGGRLLKNGKKARAGDRVENGDHLQLNGFGLSKARSFDADIEIVYEDDHFVVVNKPAGIAVNGNRIKTVENALAGVARPSSRADALPYPVATHRIDVPTKGLVLLAKSKSALAKLATAFQENRIKKAYMAVVHGKTPPKGRIDRALKGKKAITDFETLEVVPSKVFQHLSLVRLMPVTGRTHQLRIHMQQENHLILGDKEYAGRQKTVLGKGLFLCACRLQFDHPETGKPVDIRIKPPKRFQKIIEREKERY
ncbi:RluA family pseudouridine synthase [Flavilitoribacter nigricans]|uniref:Pseudouridine synthase n=1 Tax=Flavilitoribacter nigricans (strain ATCC 23147 / DSM 23189 / NBRC 102662 / NCIMB 1420 / SS-2) TaxID=1122177 RepID=A0A2D0MZ09_FLAN2|nr:RluA family pseudouridine synthase [Flavilitoribacter nigricans]PHN01522.1 pseudouridine synthase [Flavilitoribacter nigricans DSM 23189 = NBRC 102662]